MQFSRSKELFKACELIPGGEQSYARLSPSAVILCLSNAARAAESSTRMATVISTTSAPGPADFRSR